MAQSTTRLVGKAVAAAVVATIVGITINVATDGGGVLWWAAVVVATLATGALTYWTDRPPSSDAPGRAGAPAMSTHSTTIYGDVTVHPEARRPRRVPSIVVATVTVFVIAGGAALGWQLLHDDGPAPGQALRGTVLSTSDVASGSSVVFPAGREDRATALAWAPTTPDGQQRARATSTGGYLLGGMRLNLGLTALTDHEVVIYGIRPVQLVREPIVDGPVVQSRPEGGGPELMTFNLDAPGAVARAEPTAGRALGQPFFETTQLALSGTQQQTPTIVFTAREGAYVFRVAVDYDLDGTRYSQILDHDGQPFRVSAAVCPGRQETAGSDYSSVTDISAGTTGPARVGSISTAIYCGASNG